MNYRHFILIFNCFNVLLATIEGDNGCRIYSANTTGSASPLVSTSNKVEEFLIRLGDNFKKLVFVVEVMNSLTFQPSYRLDLNLELKAKTLSEENAQNNSEWGESLITKMFTKSRILTKDTIALKVIFRGKAYDLDTHLWWRQYKVVQIHLLAEGKVDITFGCYPEHDTAGLNATSSSRVDPQSSHSILILLIILGIILILIFIISILLTLFYFRRLKKRRLLEKQYDRHVYESLEDRIMKKEDLMMVPISLLPPPLPAPRCGYAQMSSQTQTQYDYPRHPETMQPKEFLTNATAPEEDSRCLSQSSSGMNIVSNILYNYDVPNKGSVDRITTKDEETQYYDVPNKDSIDRVTAKENENLYLEMSSSTETDKVQ